MKILKRLLLVAGSMVAIFGAMQPVAATGKAPASNIIRFDRAPVEPIRIDLAVLMRFEQRAVILLNSPSEEIDASSLIVSYRTEQRLPRTASVDLCDVRRAASNWIPTAGTNVVPLYVPLSLALEQGSIRNCESVVAGRVRLDARKAAMILDAFGRIGPSPASPKVTAPFLAAAPGPADPGIASLQAQALQETIRGAVSIGKPDAYYVKELLRHKQIARTYRMHDPDRYVLVDMAFTLHEIAPWQYNHVQFRVSIIFEGGEVLAHAMMPERVDEVVGITTRTYEIQASGNVRAVEVGGRYGWERKYESIVPIVRGFGLRESAFYWTFWKGKLPLPGSKNLSVVLEVPPKSVGRKVRLLFDLRAELTQPGYFSSQSARATQRACYFIEFRSDEPAASRCP